MCVCVPLNDKKKRVLIIACFTLKVTSGTLDNIYTTIYVVSNWPIFHNTIFVIFFSGVIARSALRELYCKRHC